MVHGGRVFRERRRNEGLSKPSLIGKWAIAMCWSGVPQRGAAALAQPTVLVIMSDDLAARLGCNAVS